MKQCIGIAEHFNRRYTASICHKDGFYASISFFLVFFRLIAVLKRVRFIILLYSYGTRGKVVFSVRESAVFRFLTVNGSLVLCPFFLVSKRFSADGFTAQDTCSPI